MPFFSFVFDSLAICFLFFVFSSTNFSKPKMYRKFRLETKGFLWEMSYQLLLNFSYFIFRACSLTGYETDRLSLLTSALAASFFLISVISSTLTSIVGHLVSVLPAAVFVVDPRVWSPPKTISPIIFTRRRDRSGYDLIFAISKPSFLHSVARFLLLLLLSYTTLGCVFFAPPCPLMWVNEIAKTRLKNPPFAFLEERNEPKKKKRKKVRFLISRVWIIYFGCLALLSLCLPGPMCT